MYMEVLACPTNGIEKVSEEDREDGPRLSSVSQSIWPRDRSSSREVDTVISRTVQADDSEMQLSKP